MRTKLALVGAASGARVAVGVLFSLAATAALSKSGATAYFQLIYLQSGLIAFLSASAFVRGAAIAGDGGSLTAAAISYFRFVSLSAVVAVPIVWLLVGSGGGLSGVSRIASVVLIVVGGGATAINAFLQGVAVVRHGAARAFLPGVIASLGGCLIASIAIFTRMPLVLLVAAWALVQGATLLCLVLAAPMSLTGGRATRPENHMFTATGVVNSGQVAAVYSVRDEWQATQGAVVSANGFFVGRLSELVLQTAYMAFGSSPRAVRRLGDLMMGGRLGPALTLSAVAGSSLLPFVVGSFAGAGNDFGFAVVEAAVMPLRLSASLALLWMLGRTSVRGYVFTVGATVIAALGMRWVGWPADSVFGLEYLQVPLSLLIICGAVLVARSERKIDRGL